MMAALAKRLLRLCRLERRECKRLVDIECTGDSQAEPRGNLWEAICRQITPIEGPDVKSIVEDRSSPNVSGR